MPCWYFEKEDLVSTPSRTYGINEKTEARYRKEAARLILEAGQILSIHYDTCASAIVYLHRFYIFQSFKHFHRFVTATSCLFLACKFSSKEKSSLNDVMKAINSILSIEQMKIFGSNPKVEIVATEQAVLETLKFDLYIEHPFSYLIDLVKQLKGDSEMIEQLMQMAWTFVNDGLCLTLCIEWEPDLLAISYIYLASRLMKFEVTDWVDKSVDFKGKWYNGFVSDVNVEIIKDVCQQILKLYSDVSVKEEIAVLSAREEEELQQSVNVHNSFSPLVVERKEMKKIIEVPSKETKSDRQLISPEQSSHKLDKHSRNTERRIVSKDDPVTLSPKHPLQTRDRHLPCNTNRRESSNFSSTSKALLKPQREDDKPMEYLSSMDTRKQIRVSPDYNEQVENYYLSRMKSLMDRRRRGSFISEKEEHLLKRHRGRSSSFSRERRSPSSSQRTRSRSGIRKWSRQRSTSPSLNLKCRSSSRPQRTRSPSWSRNGLRLRSITPVRRRCVSPNPSAVVYCRSRSPMRERKFDISDHEGELAVTKKSWNHSQFHIQSPNRDSGNLHLSKKEFEDLQRKIKEPSKVPLSREEFEFLQKEMREALTDQSPHLSNPSFVISDPILNQPVPAHIQSVFYPPPLASGMTDYRPNDVGYYPPVALGPYHLIGSGPPEFQRFQQPHVCQSVVYPLQTYFPPQMHVPPPTIACHPHVHSHPVPSTASIGENYTPSPVTHYQQPPSAWVHDFPRQDSQWNLHNQNSNIHSVPNINVTVVPNFNTTVCSSTSNKNFPAETNSSILKNKSQASTNLIQVKLSNGLPQKTKEKVSRLHFIGGNTSLRDAKQNKSDEEIKKLSDELQRKESTAATIAQSTVILESSQPSQSSIKTISKMIIPNSGVSDHSGRLSVEISDDMDKGSDTLLINTDHNKLGAVRKILIIGHTFVRQLYDAQRIFTIDAHVIIDGLHGASVDQLNGRIRSLPKTPFDVVFIDVGSFDFLDPSQMPGDVAQRIVDIGTYLTIEWKVKYIVISEIIPLRRINILSYYSNICLGNIALKNLIDKSERFIFWQHAKLGFDMNACFASSGRELSEHGIEEFFQTVQLALQSALRITTIGKVMDVPRSESAKQARK